MSIDDLSSLGYSNLSVLEETYQKFQENRSSVDPSWRQFFERYDDDIDREVVSLSLRGGDGASVAAPATEGAVGDLRISDLVAAYRSYGHLLATFNPIETREKSEPHELKLETLGFRKEELDTSFPTLGLLPQATAPLKDIIAVLREIYCGTVGVEYMGLQMPEMEQWLQQHIEPTRFKIDLSFDERKQILEHLNRSEIFESFLHTKYSGQKRFSVEGGETIIPILNAIIEQSTSLGMRQFVLGMAHRGRLNVLCNIMNKSYHEIFSEFEEGYIPDSFEGSGDVKYHRGYVSETKTDSGQSVKIILTPNPSHLEAVNAVVEGQSRALQVLCKNGDGKDEVLPILIHGDAAIAGQGIIYEILQMYRLPGYDNGGTVHVVINNQIGFTTLPRDARSTRYCTDIARSFGAPVFHVNVEDPEGCVFATKLAAEMRHRFHCDVFIELNCYRKYGHNEGDEPAFTQPLEYKLIRKKRPVREIYRDKLIQQGVLERHLAEESEESFRNSLQQIKSAIDEGEGKAPKNKLKPLPQYEPFEPVDTSVDAKTLRETAKHFCSIPESFNIHRKLNRLLDDRLQMLAEKDPKPIDWGMGEHLALATLLWQGHHVRLSGQDTRRGTFSHRHAMWMDQVKERKYFPLSKLKKDQGRFDVFNSLLSEYGALGFEYGYSMANPNALVAWEAQFGDFSNGAQIIIDQFISTGEQKWGLRVPLVMLLPHGYEGQGPEHSSARMERFLTLCGHKNLQVANPTSPAQLFHLLRRQVLMPVKKPLIVFTPKGLLRHPECVSTIDDLTKGSFQHLIDDPAKPKNAKIVVFCCGRIYYDLVQERDKRKAKDMAIVRLEQLYPLDEELLKKIVGGYPKAQKWLWVQEEPKNMGAWKFVRRRIREALPEGKEASYHGRERSASPAAGSFALHRQEHEAIMDAVFGG